VPDHALIVDIPRSHLTVNGNEIFPICVGWLLCSFLLLKQLLEPQGKHQALPQHVVRNNIEFFCSFHLERFHYQRIPRMPANESLVLAHRQIGDTGVCCDG